MSKYVIDNTTLAAIGDAIRTKEESTDAIPVTEIADRILALEGGGAVKTTFTGSELVSTFLGNNWTWYLEKYGDEITTENINSLYNTFQNNTTIRKIPFSFNGVGNWSVTVPMTGTFYGCEVLTEIGDINNCCITGVYQAFRGCKWLQSLPKFTNCNINSTNYIESAYFNGNETFKDCYRLRNDDNFKSFLSSMVSGEGSSTTIYRMFEYCYRLDEIKDFPISRYWMSSSDAFSAFNYCTRLKDLTFTIIPSTSTLEQRWTGITLDLSTYVGYSNSTVSAPADGKEVTDEATYTALKNDPDWWTRDIAYSRYNHDSAVNTINSLPDTSAYGTNTIKFKGEAGSATDGGAINTLTEEEIAVATAKGWTVTLV